MRRPSLRPSVLPVSIRPVSALPVSLPGPAIYTAPPSEPALRNPPVSIRAGDEPVLSLNPASLLPVSVLPDLRVPHSLAPHSLTPNSLHPQSLPPVVVVVAGATADAERVDGLLAGTPWRIQREESAENALKTIANAEASAVIMTESGAAGGDPLEWFRLAKRCAPGVATILCTDGPVQGVMRGVDAVVAQDAAQQVLTQVLQQVSLRSGERHATVRTVAGTLVQATALRLGRSVDEYETLARCAAYLGQKAKLGRLREELRLAALLLDVGVLAASVPATPVHDGLSAEQVAVLGAQILEASPLLRHLAPIVRSQGEHWDGSGAPRGLAKNEIPATARLVAVCRHYLENMGAPRAWTRERHRNALRQLERLSGICFDPRIVSVHQSIRYNRWTKLVSSTL